LPGLADLRHLALDLDGTLYRGGTLFSCTAPFLATLQELGIGWSYVTNNSSKGRDGYVAQLTRLGLPVAPDQVFTSGQAAIELLRADYPAVRRLYVLGTPALQGEFAAAGFAVVDDAPELVVVGFDRTLVYERLCRAAYWLAQGLPFVATHLDRVCPGDEPTVLVDAGAICACLQSAVGRTPDAVAGKPELRMLRGLMRRHGLAAHELGMVGDRLYTDMRMANASGVCGVLVLSGEARCTDLAASPDRPDHVVADVGDLARALRAARG
jgi:NagD protein